MAKKTESREDYCEMIVSQSIKNFKNSSIPVMTARQPNEIIDISANR